ncbi:hypothetical protein CEXT_85191, partial [Caerostris extrusa]
IQKVSDTTKIGNMSCENSSWINPCGLITDGVNGNLDDTHIDDTNERIIHFAEVISRQLNEIRNYMIESFPDIDEDSLISHEFPFLETPDTITEKYADSFRILQKMCHGARDLKERRPRKSYD